MKRTVFFIFICLCVNVFAQGGPDELYVIERDIPYHSEAGDREMEMNGRYEEQAYFWRMMKLNGNEDNVFLYEFDGYDHGGMPVPAHSVVKRFIRHICKGTLPSR